MLRKISNECIRTSLAVKRCNHEDIGAAALRDAVEKVGADSGAGLESRVGNGKASHGDNDSDEGLHFDGWVVELRKRLKGLGLRVGLYWNE